MTTILKLPAAHYSEADVERSLHNEAEIVRLQAQFPDVRKRYDELGEQTAVAQDRLDELKKRRAFPADIEAARQEHQRAVWAQQGVLADHSRKIRELQNENQRLSQKLRTDAHWRWFDEMKEIVSLRTIEVIETYRVGYGGAQRQDIRTNAPAIAEAKEMLLTATQQLGELQNCGIPTIQGFIDDFESELRKFDLTKLSRWDDIPKSRVDAMRPKQEESGHVTHATIMPDGKPWIHPDHGDTERINSLSDRLTKLEKTK
jgi:hypothetical protein